NRLTIYFYFFYTNLMKKKLFILIISALFILSGKAIKPSKLNKLPDSLSFICISKTDPRYFELSNGTPFIPVGPNICFPRLISDEELGFESIEMMYKNLAKYGANYSRIYLASDFFEI